jgi:hypothetical protein
MRGFDKVRAEWAIVCTAHNLLKLGCRWTPSAAWPTVAAVARKTHERDKTESRSSQSHKELTLTPFAAIIWRGS